MSEVEPTAQREAYYALKFSDGRREYFNSSGIMVAMEDRFGNTISLQRAAAPGQLITYITDALGRKTTITNNFLKYGANQPYKTTIELPDGGVITLEMTPKSDKKTILLSQITDQEGRVTKYTYAEQTGEFNFFPVEPINFEVAPNTITHQNLTKIEYPTGATTNYTYQKKKEVLALKGRIEYYRITSRDERDGSSIYNRSTYSYSPKLNYTGTDAEFVYFDGLEPGYTYWTSVTDSNGAKTQ